VTAAGRLTRCAVSALTVLVWASPASSQTAGANSTPGVEFLPRTAFHMTAERLSGDDPRFVWDANFGGDLDFVDYGVGRFTFEANYQVIIGEEIRTFDPNQGSYILAGVTSARLGATEVAAVFHHQSRHLSDRAKDTAVDWNMFGGRVRRRFLASDAIIDTRVDLRGVIQKSFVDYSWEIDSAVRATIKLRARVGALATVGLRHLGADGSQDRGGETGYRAEGGVRFEGRAGAIELFVAAERRIDPLPLEVGTARWVTAGFRLLSRE